MCRLAICMTAALLYGLTSADARCAPIYKATVLNHVGFQQAIPQGTAGEQHVGHGFLDDGSTHALLWNGAEGNAIDLHPMGFTETLATAAWAGSQVGYGSSPSIEGDGHALLWEGSAASVIDLHPAGYSTSRANGISAEGQVGTADFHAMLWSGTAASAIDLHPAPFTGGTFALGISGEEQVGGGYLPIGSDPFDPYRLHAILWKGSADTHVDLHPLGFDSSWAVGVDGGNQFGMGSGPSTGGKQHALLWSGTADSALDIHPPSTEVSMATGISNGVQVGGAGPNNQQLHAYLWQGSAASAMDLHPFLVEIVPNAQFSIASAVAPDGTIVGWATNGSGTFAVQWTPIVPEPSSVQLLLLSIAMINTLARRRDE